MRLSDIKNERTLDVVAAIIGPVSRIAMDADAVQSIRPQKLKKGENKRDVVAARASNAVSVLLTKHRDDVVSILAALEGVTNEEYIVSLNLVKLGHDLFELLTDEEFVTLFPSAQSKKISSGSALETTGAHR